MSLRDGLVLLILAAIWGASFLFMRLSVGEFGPMALILVRLGLAGLCLIPFAWRGLWKKRRIWGLLWVNSLLSTAIPFLLLSYASLRLSAGLTSLINASVPLFGALVSVAWLKQRLTRKQVLGLILGAAGILLLVWDPRLMRMEGKMMAVGAGLLACVCYAIGAAWMKRHLQELTPLEATAGSLMAGALSLLPLALYYWPENNPSGLAWSSAVSLSLLCTALAFIFFFELILRIGPNLATSVTFLIPFFGIFWGWLFLHEEVNARVFLALGITLVGTVLVTQFRWRKLISRGRST